MKSEWRPSRCGDAGAGVVGLARSRHPVRKERPLKHYHQYREILDEQNKRGKITINTPSERETTIKQPWI